MVRPGRVFNGTAQVPGAIACPTERETVVGSPRTLTKLPGGTRPTRIGRATCVDGCAAMVRATAMVGRSEACALVEWPRIWPRARVNAMEASPAEAERRNRGHNVRCQLHLGCAASFKLTPPAKTLSGREATRGLSTPAEPASGPVATCPLHVSTWQKVAGGCAAGTRAQWADGTLGGSPSWPARAWPDRPPPRAAAPAGCKDQALACSGHHFFGRWRDHSRNSLKSRSCSSAL
jgi:hypothetical protein